jgi:hypothetical protein
VSRRDSRETPLGVALEEPVSGLSMDEEEKVSIFVPEMFEDDEE